nr:5875_t:CDS:2 [Entrophospora candida]CAG8618320.1 14148_t:CDS:2 [Entrophospora candida]
MTEHQIVSVDSSTQINEKDTLFPYKLFTSGLPRQQDESSLKYHFRKLFTVKTLKILDNDKKAEFKTPLTWFDLTMLGLGGIIGGGIFVLSGQSAATTAGPAVVLSFVLAGLVSAFAALSYSELASMIPVAGSAYTYAYATMGELVAWIIGWDLILEYLVAAAAVSVSFSGYFVDFFSTAFNVNLSPSWTASPLIFNSTADSFQIIPGSYFNVPAFSLMIFLTILIIVGIKETATFNNIMVTIKVLIIVIFILAGIPYINKENYEPFVPPNEGHFDKFGGTGILAAATVVFFAYVGFDAVSTVSQESKNPRKDVPIGILTSLGIVTVLYISFSLVLTGLVPYAQLGTSAPAATAAKFIGMRWLTILVDLGAMIGLLSVALVCITGQTRIFYAMGSDNLLFPSFTTKLHPRFKTPYLATALVGIAGAVTSAILPIDVLADLTSVGTALAFFIVNIGVTILRFTNPDAPRGFKVPGGPFLLPITGALLTLLLLASAKKVSIERLFIWMAVGLILYGLYGRRYSKVNQKA